MVKPNRSSKRPQAKHPNHNAKSQFDKRSRLDKHNPDRQKTTHAKFPLVGTIADKVTQLSSLLDARSGFRLAIIMAGMMLADDRRVAAAWFASAGVQDDWDCFYDCLISVGRRSQSMSLALLTMLLKKFAPGADGHLTIATDDTPTARYGKHVEGAGVHHNPTPGPAGSDWLYGHNWVVLALLIQHPLWGVIAFPLFSMLYVRAIDVPPLAEKYGWEFQTKHQLAVEMVSGFVQQVRWLKLECQIWFVADGAYAARPLIKPLMEQGVVMFSRLRSDAVLHDLPPQRKSSQAGRPRIYGTNRISLSKRAGQRRGWQTIDYRCRGDEVTRQYKTFLATSRLTGGVIRVVIVKFDNGGWAAYFCTDAEVSVRDVLETIADRWAIEEFFHDTKEVWGAGQQQVRNVWSNIGCWHLNMWMYTLVEWCSWESSHEELSDRSDRPWDNPDRRPSHADKRRTISHKMLRNQLNVVLPDTPDKQQLQSLIEHLIRLAA
jgi:hypothetical protein